MIIKLAQVAALMTKGCVLKLPGLVYRVSGIGFSTPFKAKTFQHLLKLRRFKSKYLFSTFEAAAFRAEDFAAIA
jgi:hypothetical protein